MPSRPSIIAPLNAIASTIAVAVSLFLPPGLYGIVTYSNLVVSMEYQAKRDAEAITHEIINRAPRLWQFQEVRLQEMMSLRLSKAELADEARRVLDVDGKLVAAVGAPQPWPAVTRSEPLFDAGRQVGRLEIKRSLWPLLIQAAWLSLFGLALAAGSFITLRLIPLRSVLRANEALRQSEEKIRKSEEHYRNLVEATSDYLWELSEDGRFTYVSPAVKSLLGYDPAELLGKTPFDIMPADEALRVAKQFEPIAREHQSFSQLENTVVRKDGTLLVLETSGVPIFADDGSLRGYRGIDRNVTERKRAEETRQAQFARTQAQLRMVGEVGQAQALFSGDVDSLARQITEMAAKVSGCERVNVWLFNEAETELHCIDLYEATPARHSSGMVLREQDFHDEISVIKTTRYVNADDPLTDPRTKGYVESYLKPLRITSMLDASVRVGERNFGLLCFEHVDKPHHWEEDEIAFAGQLADKIGLSVLSRMRREAEQALQRRDALQHMAAVSAAEFVTAPSLEEAINSSLALVSQTIGIDRMIVFEDRPAHGASPTLRYAWHAPHIKTMFPAHALKPRAELSPQLLTWLEPLSEGKAISASASTATGDVKALLELAGAKSTLQVPISVDGKYWGQIAFDSCTHEQTWPNFEVDILKTLADLIGNAIQRDRYVKELADANRIVQNSPTILYRMRGEPALPMIYASQNVELFGYEPAALVASPQLYKSLIHPDDLAAFREAMARALENHGQRSGVVEVRMLSSRGDYRWFENRFAPVRDEAGRLIEIEGLLFDITERKAAEERIAQLARTDPLTGLANRSTFVERLKQLFAAFQRGGGRFALLYLDIDRFKDINDTLGHPVGDRLLVIIGERLKNTIRDVDLVGRVGGDEFAVLQTDLEDTADAGGLAAKLRAAVAEPVHIGGNEVHVTMSIGISVCTSDTAVPEDLLAQGDVALYRAKEEGRDQYRFHTEELDIRVRSEVALADELRTALERGEFKLYYQPQVELDTGRIVGMEALIRWNHPTRGLLTPSAFLPIAERTGTITAIGQWVLDRACQQMGAWRKTGIAPQTIAVNISLAQIKADVEFLKLVTDTLERWHLVPADLELDVTESMLARATMAQNDVLERLQNLGIKISIDDFGTKYSTLDYLRTYRVNRLKIPQRLVDAAPRDPESAAMVRAIVGIARELNIDVIAQGVENRTQWSFLTTTGPVKKVQGFYYSEPVPAERAEELLRRRELRPESSRPRVEQHSMTV